MPSKRIAVLLLAFAPAVAAAHTVRVPSQAELRRAWHACIEAELRAPREVREKPINWAQFNRACARAAKRAAKNTP